MPVKVLCYCPAPLDGTAYWRIASPFGLLRRDAQDLQVTIVDKVNTNLILDHDLLVLQRPFLNEHVEAMRAAHVLGRKVWCDWDDDILGVPNNNPRVFVYQQDNLKDNAKAMMRAADVVTVTCEHLAKKFRGVGADPVIVLPNALDPTLELPPADTNRLPVRRVAWRGGDSHNDDLRLMGGAFPRIAQELEGEVLWDFIGFNPWWLLDTFPSESVRVHMWINDTVKYLRFMGQMRPSILAVPLADTSFNRAKSNISVLEAAWFGAVPVVPKWLEGCDLPGAFTYENHTDFEQVLRAAATATDAELATRLADLRAAVTESYGLARVNLMRALILKRLLGTEAADAGDNAAVAVEKRPTADPQ